MEQIIPLNYVKNITYEIYWYREVLGLSNKIISILTIKIK